VERRQGAGGSWAVLSGSLPANSTGYNDGAVTVGLTYYYRVQAYNSFGYSGYSNEIRCSISGQLQITVTIENPQDETITFTRLDDVVVSPADTLTVSVGEMFDAYEWFLDGAMISGTVAISIDCSLQEPGVHHLAVFVETNGFVFSNALRFFIVN